MKTLPILFMAGASTQDWALLGLVIVSFVAGAAAAGLTIDWALAVSTQFRDDLRDYLNKCDEADGRAVISKERQ